MEISVRVDVMTREDGIYYPDPADVVRHVTMWIEDGLSDRDDLEQVTVTELGPDPTDVTTLAKRLNTALGKPVVGRGCRLCSASEPEPPCMCGCDYHGHGGMGLNYRCLNCDCRRYVKAENYARCGAWGGCAWPLGHNRGYSDIPENHEIPGPDWGAAQALAQYIANQSASTVMAACRHLGWRLEFDLVEGET